MRMIKVYDKNGNYKDSFRPDPNMSLAVQDRIRHAAGVYTKRELKTHGIKIKKLQKAESK